MIYTRKISLELTDPSKINDLIELHNNINLASNYVVNDTFYTWLEPRRKAQEELLKKRGELKNNQDFDDKTFKEEIKIQTEIFRKLHLYGMRGEKTKTEDSISYNTLSLKFGGLIPASILTSLNRSLYKTLNSQKNDILEGKKSLPNFVKNQPIPFNYIRSENNSNFPIFKISEENYVLKPFPGFEFNLIFGKDKSGNQAIVDQLINKNPNYRLADSSIDIKYDPFKKTPVIDSITFLMVFDLKESSVNLDPNKVLGIDIGINAPIYYHIKDSKISGHIGEPLEFYKEHIQRKKRIRNLQKSFKIGSKSGEGRKNKTKPIYNIKQAEKNWMKNFNHRLSSEIIAICLKYDVGTIHLEDLTNVSSGSKFNFLKNWPYYQLQEFISYKAKSKNIQVKFIKPAYTSINCHKCGQKGERSKSDYNSISKLNKEDMLREFHFFNAFNLFKCINQLCENYNKPFNADKNAAINIANSDKLSFKNIKIKNKEERKLNKKNKNSYICSIVL